MCGFKTLLTYSENVMKYNNEIDISCFKNIGQEVYLNLLWIEYL